MSTRAEILAQIASLLPDNTTRAISPEDLRTVVNNLANSCNNSTDEGTPAAAVATHATDPAAHGLLAAKDGVRSSARAKTAYAAPVAWIENWANLENWTLAAANSLSVSGGKLITGSVSDGRSCGNRAFALGTGDTGRVVAAIHYVAGLPYGLFIGLSNDAAGAAPTAGIGSGTGLFFTSGQVKTMDRGAQVYLCDEPETGDYIATITVDLSYFSVVLTNSAGTVELQSRFPRAGYTIGNVEVFNTDPRGAAGCTIGTVGARKNSSSLTPRTNIEGVAPTVGWGGNGIVSWQVALPAAYDSQTQVPLVVMCHGNGTDETHFGTYAPQKLVRDAFLAAGYACMTANHNAGGGSTWGNQQSLDAYFAAYQWCRDHYNVGPVVLYGNSMGGLESLLMVAERRIPVVAWIGTMPAVSLATAAANPTYTDLIASAYSGASIIGHDPLLMTAADFGAVPMLAVVATDDTSTPPATNWAPFSTMLGDYPLEVITLTTTGGHGADLSGFTAAMTTFAGKFI